MKWKATDWEKIPVQSMPDKDLLSRIYRKFLKLNIKDMKNPIINWAKELSTISMKIHIWEVSIWKNVQHHIGNCKLKQQWDTTIHPRKWQKFKILTPPNASKDVEKEPSPLLRLQNGTADLEYSLTVSYKIKLFTDYCTFQGTIL